MDDRIFFSCIRIIYTFIKTYSILENRKLSGANHYFSLPVTVYKDRNASFW